jgi:hypothetical protein
MYEQQLEKMSIDELWALYERTDAILSARLVAKKDLLEKRLDQLRQEPKQRDPRS